MNILKENLNAAREHALDFLRWIILAIITGFVVGGVGILFVKGLGLASNFRGAHPEIILGLPLAGLALVFLYKISNYENDKGTNLVISTLHAESQIPFRMAPLIFVATITTHLFGGSAGREGAALQLGGSIGNQLGRWFRLDEDDTRLIVMCGMSAAFSAIFGTPLAAVVFAMEVATIGGMQYAAFVPCMCASLVASTFATSMGCHAEAFTITEPVDFAVVPALLIVVLGILCALISVLFCQALHSSGHLFKKYLPNPYLRIAVGALAIILLTIILQTSAYSGAGVNLIEEAFLGEAPKMAFLWKIIFTAITLGVGFKGGEIVPSFCIGATFGCLFGTLVGLSPSLCAAVGMVAVFCGVTNSPITSLVIGFEMFGFDCMKYLLIGVAISYMLSGYTGLYSEQTILQSKFKTQTINIKTH
ncbi:MAG: chloride channel protein [Faecalimonas sp.]|nr:chloride channel protein [Faecalimonas sp.]